MKKTLKNLNARLCRRYERLVTEVMNANESLPADMKSIPNKISSFASTQAAWRFYKNDKVRLSKLQEPLTEAAHEEIAQYCQDYALCIHDRSRLSYKHENKKDMYSLEQA